MSRIHGRDPMGNWCIGVEVFRRLYTAAGFHKAVWVSRLPLIRSLLDVAYVVFAKNRLRITGRLGIRRRDISKDTLQQSGPPTCSTGVCGSVGSVNPFPSVSTVRNTNMFTKKRVS